MARETKQRVWWAQSLETFFRVSLWIVAPLIGALFVGKYLDMKFHTEPWIFIFSSLFAFSLSLFKIIFETRKHMQTLAGEDLEDSKDKQDS